MKIIDGKLIASEIKQELKQEVLRLKDQGIVPGLGIILVGNNDASEIYVRNKMKVCEELGIQAYLYRFDESNQEEEIVAKILELNQDINIDGVLVQCPLPTCFNEERILAAVDSNKDVDGFGVYHLGALLSNHEEIIAATPLGILKMLEHEHIEVRGKHVVMVGASIIVGRPMATVLLNRGATVSVLHRDTLNLKELTRQADILIVAIGNAKFITDEYVKDGAVVIDVGTNYVDGKLYGDVDFETVSRKASYITPVPGGVGPMTIVCLLSNLVDQAKKRRNIDGSKN